MKAAAKHMINQSFPPVPSVLLVEDDPDLAWVYRNFLAKETIALEHVATGAGALDRVAANPPTVMLLDLKLPDMSGLEVLERIQANGAPTAVIVITGLSGVDIAVEAMQAGAYDFLAKPFKAERLTVTLRNAVERQRLAGLLENTARERFHGFLGAALPMQALYRAIESVGPSKAAVFITGESGTGKEVCAQAVHACGAQPQAPFVVLNCAAIARDLMESEVFGHAKGAFTGAHSARAGAARRADGGTLFLDEICEMDLALQTKLLRFAQSGAVQAVGSDKIEQVEVRLICATNRDPWAEVQAGRLREDLYYRLHVVPLHIPPLRERGADVLLLANGFLAIASREEGKNFRGFDTEVEQILTEYYWPGNVRQLQNAIRHIAVLHQGPAVRRNMLPAPLYSRQLLRGSGARRLKEIERAAIETALNECGGNITKAARQLGINPSTLHRKRHVWARAASP